MCEECNIVFIGPDADIIDKMGNKSNAREMMMKANVPVIPGSKRAILNDEDGLNTANEIGYPVMIKASAGGGGRGIRIVRDEKDFLEALHKIGRASCRERV